MNRDSRVQLLAVAVLAVTLTASGLVSSQLTASAGRNKLGFTEIDAEGQPPQVAVGIAMGAFRGLFVNFLWMRANALKEAGRYYEAIDLASTITKLQPRFPQVWVFHAWNMAYNISVTTQTLSERWMWVQQGLALLRDEGIPANPNDMLIHKELAWIYLHKIQGFTDDANPYYKRQVAAEWMGILGQPPAPDPLARDRAGVTKKYVEWLRPIVEAPETLQEVISADPRVGQLVTQLRERVGVEPGRRLLEIYQRYLAIRRSGQRGALMAQADETGKAMAELVDDPENAKAWDELLAHVRRRVLVDRYHMEPERMLRYTEKYGPIDWRHPAAHALYWSARGVEVALPRYQKENRDFDLINTDRMVVQSVQELWRSGELYFDYFGWFTNPQNTRPFYLAAPNIQFIQVYGEILDEVAKRSWADAGKKVYSPYAAGYENFVKDAIRFLYRRGQKDLATKYKDDLGKWKNQNLNDPDRPGYFAQSIDDFVKAELGDRLSVPNVAKEEIVGALQGAYISGLLASDAEAFRNQFEYARAAHTYYFNEHKRKTSVDPSTNRQEQLPQDFRLLAGGVFAQIMSILTPDDAETVYGGAPNDLRLFAYDTLQDSLREAYDTLAKQGGRSFDAAFPAPEGLEAFHEWYKRAREEESQRQQIQTQQK